MTDEWSGGTCSRCGTWLDDLERASAPYGVCFDCHEERNGGAK